MAKPIVMSKPTSALPQVGDKRDHKPPVSSAIGQVFGAVVGSKQSAPDSFERDHAAQFQLAFGSPAKSKPQSAYPSWNPEDYQKPAQRGQVASASRALDAAPRMGQRSPLPIGIPNVTKETRATEKQERGFLGFGRVKTKVTEETTVKGAGQCWINSIMQMFINIPSLNASLRRLPTAHHAPIHEFMDAYELQRQAGSRVADQADPQKLREHLCDMSAVGLSRDPQRREDAGQAMMLLLRDAEPPKGAIGQVPPPPFFREEFERPHRISNPYFGSMLSLNPDPNPKVNLSFAQMLKNYFRDDATETTRYLLEPPSDLFVQIGRFAPDGESPDGKPKYTKNTNHMDTPEVFQLPGEYSRNRESPTYECDAFIMHHGEDQEHGHYVAYIKKDGQWYCANDKEVKPVSAEVADEYRAQAYLFHYTKL